MFSLLICLCLSADELAFDPNAKSAPEVVEPAFDPIANPVPDVVDLCDAAADVHVAAGYNSLLLAGALPS